MHLYYILYGLFILLIIGILIIVILSHTNYYTNYYNNIFEKFENPNNSQQSTIQSPDRVRIIYLTDSSFKIKFSYPKPNNQQPVTTTSNNTVATTTTNTNINSNATITNFIIILTQIDSQGDSKGELKIMLSDEKANSSTSICSASINSYTCGHTFTDVHRLDEFGKNYLYRIGVAAINSANIMSDFVEPSNIPITAGGMKLFPLEPNFKFNDMNNILSGFEKMNTGFNGNNNNNNMEIGKILDTGVDSQFELLSKQLGGFPYGAILDSKSNSQNMLGDLIGKSLADGVINVKVGSNN